VPGTREQHDHESAARSQEHAPPLALLGDEAVLAAFLRGKVVATVPSGR